MAFLVRCILCIFLIAEVQGFGYHVDLANLGARRVEVHNDIDLVAALQDDSIDRIVLMRDMRLGADWDVQNLFPLHIRRNLTIKSSLEAAAFASLDFRYLSGKLRLEPGVWLSIFRLRLRGLTASHAPSFPFVAISPGAHVLFQDCLLHRSACVPIDLVYDSMLSRAPYPRAGTTTTAAAEPPPIAVTARESESAVDGAAAAGLAGSGNSGQVRGPGPGVAAGLNPAGAADIQLLHHHCFTTVAAGRQCRPLALHLRNYSYETQRRQSGAVGTGGFVLHAHNTTVVCDYPVSPECIHANGPEFCVTREWSRRQRQQEWHKGAACAVAAVAGTLAALVAGWWLLRRQLPLPRPHPHPGAEQSEAAVVSSSGGARALSPPPVAALQWLAHMSAEAEAEAEEAVAASGIPCRRPLLRMPSAMSSAPWSLGAAGAMLGPYSSPTSNTDVSSAAGGGGGGGRALEARTYSRTSTRDFDQPTPGHGSERSAGRSGHGPSGDGGGPGPPTAAASGRIVLRESPAVSLGEEGGAPGAPTGGQPGEMLEYLDRLFGACEVIPASEGNSTSSSVVKAAAETQERIIHIRQTMNVSGGAAGAGSAGADVYDNLEVTELLGSGTFGKVFKGFWHGTLVAVKLMVFPAALTGQGQLERMAAMEAAISSSLSHPNIVQTYTWRVTPLLSATTLQPDPPAGAAGAAGAAAVGMPPAACAEDSPRRRNQAVDEPQLKGTAASAQVQLLRQQQAAANKRAAVPPLSPVSPTQDPKQPTDQLQTLQRRQVSPAETQPAPGVGAGPGPSLARTSAPSAAAAVLAAASSPPSQQRYSVPGRAASANPLPAAPAATGAGPLSAAAGVLSEGFELCLILELCDAGSLRDMLSRGGFRRSTDHGSVDLGELLDVATDVARAMSYLHGKNIVHSDLKSRNVLLKSVSGNPAALGRRCAVIAKVSDFGLSLRIENDATHVSNMFQGTTAFMAPELLLFGRVSKASDVYSFGILLWEMYTCAEAFKNVPKALLPGKVVEGLRPDFPPEAPARYLRLAEQCWQPDPVDRPSFDQIIRELNCLRAAEKGEPPPAPAQSLGSVTAQLRRNSSAVRAQQSRTQQLPSPSHHHQQQQQQQQQPPHRHHHSVVASSPRSPPLPQRSLQKPDPPSPPPQQQQALVSPQFLQRHSQHPPLNSWQRRSPPSRQHQRLETVLSGCDSDGGPASARDTPQPVPLPLLTEAVQSAQRRTASAGVATEGVVVGSAGGGAAAAASIGGGQPYNGRGCDSGELLSVAAMPAAGSSSFGALQLQRLIDANLLVVGGCEGGSTIAGL